MQMIIVTILIFTICCSAIWAAPQGTKPHQQKLLVDTKKVDRKFELVDKPVERNIRLQDPQCAKLLDQMPAPLSSYLEQIINKGEVCRDYKVLPYRFSHYLKRTQPNDFSHQIGDGVEINFHMSSKTEAWAVTYFYGDVTYESKLVRMDSNAKLKQFEPMLGDLDKYVDSDALKDFLKPASIEHQTLSGSNSAIKLKDGQLINGRSTLTEAVRNLGLSGFMWVSSGDDYSSDFKEFDEKNVFVRLTPDVSETGVLKVETITIETYEHSPL